MLQCVANNQHCVSEWQVVLTTQFGWLMGQLPTKAGWRYVTTASGALSVMTSGMLEMQMLYAGNWE